ncbi:MAG: hypothetical protein JO090_15480 [Rhizobacter sp.]|nr:hypothetical protein [Rhizobacter sp.]
MHALMARIDSAGGRVYVPRADRDHAVGVGLRMPTLRGLVFEREGLFGASADELALLRYYANSFAHVTG